MSYIVPRDKPTECHGCPFCDIYTYDCRLQRVQYETFDEQYADCPLIDGAKDCYTCGGSEMCMYALNEGQETRINCPLWRSRIGSKTN